MNMLYRVALAHHATTNDIPGSFMSSWGVEVIMETLQHLDDALMHLMHDVQDHREQRLCHWEVDATLKQNQAINH